MFEQYFLTLNKRTQNNSLKMSNKNHPSWVRLVKEIQQTTSYLPNESQINLIATIDYESLTW